jgi:hypothetical protein
LYIYGRRSLFIKIFCHNVFDDHFVDEQSAKSLYLNYTFILRHTYYSLSTDFKFILYTKKRQSRLYIVLRIIIKWEGFKYLVFTFTRSFGQLFDVIKRFLCFVNSFNFKHAFHFRTILKPDMCFGI